MKRAKKRVLVTGGTGFLGSYLCEHLLDASCDFTYRDNYFTGSKSNILALCENPYFELLRHVES